MAHRATMPRNDPDTTDRQSSTPFADALLRLTSTEVASVHALPLSQGHGIAGSRFRQKYLALVGQAYLHADVSFSSPVIDSFFKPRGCLAAAQRLAAEAFGADHTFFLTSGTTTSNTVALTAMAPYGRRILVDRTAHQSVHFGVDRSGAEVTYAGMSPRSPGGFVHGDIEAFVEEFAEAARQDRPYHAVVLNGSSYDGSLLQLPALFDAMFDHVDTLDVLVDEAWSALNTFHPRLRATTALAAGRHLRITRPDKKLRLYVTHSAHKSMSALRQASFLHVLGDGDTVRRAERALYAVHTTSPSLPILASLDLARAQAVAEGHAVAERCLAHAQRLRTLLDDGLLPGLVAVEPEAASRWSAPDPAKVVCDSSGLGISAQDLRIRMFHEHGIYASRGSGTRILFNIHAGVTDAVMDRLERALSELCASGTDRFDRGPGFLIPYPPGVPLTVPGEQYPDNLDELLRSFRTSGVDVFAVPAHAPSA
ncbi:MAG: hypothetical protein QG671_1486 [Actinomycetota bacterium]|nr:hypothetical protein [Actinomycetota bacterium]